MQDPFTVRGRSRAMVRPLLRAVGHLPGVVRFAGRQVERDVWVAAPPLAVLARLFRWLPADRRGRQPPPLPPLRWPSSRS